VTDTNLVRFRAAVEGALRHLESRRQEVNDLNVFPVADGDTGDNMTLTLRAVLDELDRLGGADETRTVDEIGRETLVQSVARAALLGARGNSGVILSQLIRGAAEELVSRPGQLIDAKLIAAALENASSRAYASVRSPAEGTILTVARAMAHQIVTDVAHDEATQISADTTPDGQDLAIAGTLERAVAAGQESVKQGPQLLAALRDAGVVDAGGYALTVIFAGVVAALRGDEPPELDHHAPARISHPEHSSETYRFCTNFAVTGEGLQPGRFIPPLEEIGDSVLVVGDSTTLKIHLHTDEPERATAVFADAGQVSRLDVADMSTQVAEREQRLSGQPAEPQRQMLCGALAVINGEGFGRLFAELGVHTIDGGPTLNPSTYDLLAAIHGVPSEEVLVLPGNANVIMAAERAAELSDKRVRVAQLKSQQAGLAAAVALDFARDVEENARAVAQASASLRTGAVAPAARDDAQGRFTRGEAVGFLEEEIIAWGDPGQALGAVIDSLCEGCELISVLAGAQAPLDCTQVKALLDRQRDVELELRHGGQQAYWWLLVAE
jgi:DAK2 domain fusion protein YloV